MRRILILLILMILLSFFSGISLNGQWAIISQYEFVDFPQMMKHFSSSQIAVWVGLIFVHLGLLLLPFLVRKPYFNKALFWFPGMFLVLLAILNILFFILLTPFMIVWIITLIYSKRMVALNDK